MAIGISVARLAALVGVAVFPLAAQTPQGRSCWLRDAAAPAGSVVYALCEQGSYWSTADAGATWTRGDTGAAERLRAMAFVDAKRGFVIGDRGLMMATEDGGKTWKARTLGVKPHLMDIGFVGESGWVAGYQGTILHTEDGGRTWSKQDAKTNQTLEAISFADKDNGWVVGWSGTILRTSDGGKNWNVVKCEGATWSLSSIYFKDSRNGWLVGFNGQILRSRDGGTTWQPQASPVKSWLTNITFDSAGRGWITYDDGLLLSEDAGETWKAVPVAGRFFLSKLQKVRDELWAIGQTTILKQDGMKWTKITSLTTNSTTGTARPGTVAPPKKASD